MRELSAFALFCISIALCAWVFGESVGMLVGAGLIYMKVSSKGPFKSL